MDRFLTLGCSLSCTYFEAFSSFLEWVVRDMSGCASVIHYFSDFLCVGVPLAQDKKEGHTTQLVFLGITIDIVRMECRLPDDKLQAFCSEVRKACRLKKIKIREIQSLLGKLNFVCRVIPMGRIFSWRLAVVTSGVASPHHYIRLGKELRGICEFGIYFLGGGETRTGCGQ